MKRIAALIAAAVFCLALSGCGIASDEELMRALESEVSQLHAEQLAELETAPALPADGEEENTFAGEELPDDEMKWFNEYTGEYTVEDVVTDEGIDTLYYREDGTLAQKDIIDDIGITTEYYDENEVLRQKEVMSADGKTERWDYNEKGALLEYYAENFSETEHIRYHADGTFISRNYQYQDGFEGYTYYPGNVLEHHWIQKSDRSLDEFYEEDGRLSEVHQSENHVNTKTRYNEDGSYEKEISENNITRLERYDSEGNLLG